MYQDFIYTGSRKYFPAILTFRMFRSIISYYWNTLTIVPWKLIPINITRGHNDGVSYVQITVHNTYNIRSKIK